MKTKNLNPLIGEILTNQTTKPKETKTFTAKEIITELEDSDHLDDAITFFSQFK